MQCFMKNLAERSLGSKAHNHFWDNCCQRILTPGIWSWYYCFCCWQEIAKRIEAPHYWRWCCTCLCNIAACGMTTGSCTYRIIFTKSPSPLSTVTSSLLPWLRFVSLIALQIARRSWLVILGTSEEYFLPIRNHKEIIDGQNTKPVGSAMNIRVTTFPSIRKAT